MRPEDWHRFLLGCPTTPVRCGSRSRGLAVTARPSIRPRAGVVKDQTEPQNRPIGFAQGLWVDRSRSGCDRLRASRAPALIVEEGQQAWRDPPSLAGATRVDPALR